MRCRLRIGAEISKKEKPQKDEVPDEKLEEVSGGKLKVAPPKDTYEREADAAADKVIEP